MLVVSAATSVVPYPHATIVSIDSTPKAAFPALCSQSMYRHTPAIPETVTAAFMRSTALSRRRKAKMETEAIVEQIKSLLQELRAKGISESEFFKLLYPKVVNI